MDGRVSRAGGGVRRPSLAGGGGVVVLEGGVGAASAALGRDVSTVAAGGWIGPGAAAGPATAAESADWSSRLDDALHPSDAIPAAAKQTDRRAGVKMFRVKAAS